MKTSSLTRRNLILPLSLCLVWTTACSSGGSGSTGTSIPDDPVPDLTGTWRVTEDVSASACEPAYTDTYTISVAQSGDNLTVTAPSGTFSGSINNNVISWTGSYPQDGGTVTITSMQLGYQASDDTIRGNTTWSWTDGVFSCNGTTQVVVTRISSSPASLAATNRGSVLLLGDGVPAVATVAALGPDGDALEQIVESPFAEGGMLEVELPAGEYELRLTDPGNGHGIGSPFWIDVRAGGHTAVEVGTER